MKITIYVTGRHIKDILRSISHELIHHVQNCRGDLSGMQDTSLGYAQRDKHMRDMETEAFNSGNIMIFRDFEDNYKQENRKMSKLQENRLKKLNGLLMERAGSYEEVAAKEIIRLLHRDTGEEDAEDKIINILRRVKNRAKKNPQLANKFVKVYMSEQPTGTIDKNYLDTNWKSLGFANRTLAKAMSQQILKLSASVAAKARASAPAKARASVAAKAPKADTPQTPTEFINFGPLVLKPSASARASGKGPRKYRKCTGILRMGCGGDNIEVLQRKLHNVLKLKSNVDSFADKKFWTGTKRAVKAFQRAAKLKVDGEAGPNTLKALDAAVAGKLGIATPKGPAGDIDRLAKPGSEISDIFRQVVKGFPLVPQDETKQKYRSVRKQVMKMIANELGSDKRKDYLTADNKISRLKTANKIKGFITTIVQKMDV